MSVRPSAVKVKTYKILSRIFLPGLLLFCLSYGCAHYEQKAERFKLIKPTTSEELRFEDESVLIRFTPERKKLYFTLWNKTQAPMKILWDEVMFIDPEGKSHWVLNAQESYREVGRAAMGAHPLLDLTIIPPGTSHGDYVRPYPEGLQEFYIYPAKEAQGSRFNLVLPLEINERTKVYTFGFEVIE
jgi:hypothetical protein